MLGHGSKSGSRKIVLAAGINLAPGHEDLGDEQNVSEALHALKSDHPALERAVVKLNEGFSGEGNAIFRFDGAPTGTTLRGWILERVDKLAFEAAPVTWDAYCLKIKEMGAIVEAFIEGDNKRSPSSQYWIDPTDQLDIISTHDQVLGGGSGQISLGCRFPPDAAYRLAIQEACWRAVAALAAHSVLGRFGVTCRSARSQSGT